MRTGKRQVLGAAPDPRARIRADGLAYGAFRVRDEKEGDLMLFAVLCGDLVQLGLAAMENENIIQLHDLVYLILGQMIQSLD